MMINLLVLRKYTGLVKFISCLFVISLKNQSRDKNYRTAKRSSTLFHVLSLLVLLGKPALGLASMCIPFTPDELIQKSDLIFKGKVIEVKILLFDKVIVNEAIEKIWFRSDVKYFDKLNVTLKAINPQNDPDRYKLFYQAPSALHDFVKYQIKYKMLASYKGPVLENIVVKRPSVGIVTIGEEEMVFADGDLLKGYRTSRCGGSTYYLAIKDGDLSYKKALDAYRQKQEQLTTALQLSPRNPALLTEQGALYLQYHDFDSAEWAYQELRLHHPKNVAGWVGLTDVKFQRAYDENDKDKKILYAQTLSDYRNILKIDPNNHAARHGETLSLLYLERGSEVDKNARDFSGYIKDFSGYTQFGNIEYEENANDFFAGKNLIGANFRNANLWNFNFSNADLRHTDFTGATLLDCDFTGAILTNATFRNVQYTGGTKFVGAKLQHADFTEAKLEKVDFSHADLQGADFTKAALNGSSLAKAKIKNTKFTNANTCGMFATTWPIGFDPHSVGVKTCK
ncbi:hypothetical protein JCM14076_24090 [Methylosoma difficile]